MDGDGDDIRFEENKYYPSTKRGKGLEYVYQPNDRRDEKHARERLQTSNAARTVKEAHAAHTQRTRHCPEVAARRGGGG